MSKFTRTVLQIRPVGRPLRWISPITRVRTRPVRCSKDKPEKVEAVTDDAEDRIAKLEAAAKGGRILPDEIEVIEDEGPKKRRWNEYDMLPEGWDDLTFGEKAWEIYAGERGMLFWANRVAFAAAISLGVAWILFRFALPLLGLYELKSTFTS